MDNEQGVGADAVEATGVDGGVSGSAVASTGDAAQDEAQTLQFGLLQEGARAEPSAAAQAQVPEKYSLSIPDGAFSAEQTAIAEQQFRELGLTNEAAQKLVDLSLDGQRQAMEAHLEQVDRWADEIRADRELGGANFDATCMQAKDGLSAFDEDGRLKSLLVQSGYQNHPDVIRFLSRLGKKAAEHGLVTGKGLPKERPLWERLYANEQKNEQKKAR